MTDSNQPLRASTHLYPDWARQIVIESIDEAESEFRNPELAMRKNAFELSIDPASLIGALAGYAVAKRTATKQMAETQLAAERAKPKLTGDYYSQMDNVLKNLRVTFTPIGATYVLRSGNRDIGIETLETSEMTPEMRRAWMSRDEQFFRNMKLNQMQADLHLAEQLFAQRLLQRHRLLKMNADKLANLNDDQVEELVKQAAEAEEPESEQDLMIPLDEIWEGMQSLRKLAERAQESSVAEKYCSLLFRSATNEPVRTIHGNQGWRRDVTLEKNAALVATPLNFFGLGHGRYLNPSVLHDKLKVAFLPDRVLYVYDQMVVGQTHISQLNEDGFKHFRRQDIPYFRKFISGKLADGHTLMRMGAPEATVSATVTQVEKTASALVEPDPIVDKEAMLSVDELEDIFDDYVDDEAEVHEAAISQPAAIAKVAAPSSPNVELWTRNDIHPFVYYVILTKRYGQEWVNWDPVVLIKAIETDFGAPALADVPMNKALYLQLINNNSTPVENYHLFEKLVRTFNNRDIDFLERESIISLAEIVNTLMIVAENSPFTDPYEILSEDTREFIVEVLVDGEYQFVCPPTMTKNNEAVLWDDLNERIREKCADITANDLDESERSAFEQRIARIQTDAKQTVELLRSKGFIPSEDQVNGLIRAAAAKNNGVIDEELVASVTRAIMKNIAVDHFMKQLRGRIQEQMLRYAQ